jgi:hypothetical protein
MTTGTDGPLLLCYDGSEDARHAIERAGALLGGRQALVLTVWQPTRGLGSFAWAARLQPWSTSSSSTAPPPGTPEVSPRTKYVSRKRWA